MAKIETGTVIRGTTRNEDLIVAFYRLLRRLDAEAAAPYASTVQQIEEDALPVDLDGEPVYDPDDMRDFAIELEDAINDALPAELYFGAHTDNSGDWGIYPTDSDELE